MGQDKADMPPERVSAFAAAIVASVLGLTAIGGAVDVSRLLRRPTAKRGTPSWALCLLAACYALIVPGLLLTLFSFDLAASFYGLRQELYKESENTLELIAFLLDEGLVLAAVCVTATAIVVPATKGALLAVGLTLQTCGSASGARLLWARRCLVVVKFLAKWASPGKWAYIFMFCLFRSLHKPPKLLSEISLGLGFTCFGTFCMGSTLASAALHLPGEPAERGVHCCLATSAGGRRRQLPPLVGVSLVSLAALTFFACLGVGVSLPVMSLRLDMDLMYKQRPDIAPFAFIIDTLGLPELLYAELSGLECLGYLGKAAAGGDINCALATVMYGLFVLLGPFADMCFLLFASCVGCRRSGKTQDPDATARVGNSLAISRVLGKLSMLDVSLFGVVIGVLSLQSVREDGLILELGPGMVLLFAAVVCLYVVKYLVSRQCQDAFVPPVEAVAGSEEGAPTDAPIPAESGQGSEACPGPSCAHA